MKFIYIFLAIVFLISCSDISREEAKDLQNAYFSLISKGKVSKKLSRVDIIFNNRKIHFKDSKEIAELKGFLQKSKISGSNLLARNNSSTMILVGSFILYLTENKFIEYELYQSARDFSLLRVNVFLVGDTVGTSLNYFYCEWEPCFEQ
ncbi:MAG: hypothetical protein AAGA18_07755 [Verrucomicrobiota bacterium]